MNCFKVPNGVGDTPFSRTHQHHQQKTSSYTNRPLPPSLFYVRPSADHYGSLGACVAAGADRFKCYAMMAGWAGAIMVTMAIQCYLVRRKKEQDSADATERRHDRYAEERAGERDRIRERYSHAGNDRASWRTRQSRRGPRPESRAEPAMLMQIPGSTNTGYSQTPGTRQGWSVNGSGTGDGSALSYEQEQYHERGW